jgi:UDP-N-acetylglucosamine 2-epimerase (non-hydrolysing)
MAPKILTVAGARPNFMKVAAICEAIKNYNYSSGTERIKHFLVHTGQHYDVTMSDLFFNDLGLPRPDLFFGVGSASHARQTARIMERFEAVLLQENPDLVLVVGDVNSTLACALVTKKTLCSAASGKSRFIPKLAHVEAGLRSFDRTMPEEVNRVVTDALSDYLFTTEESANRNLLQEGIAREKIHFVGNVMIDTLLRHRSKAEQSMILSHLQLYAKENEIHPYAVLTLHRPANVEDKERLSQILKALLEIAAHIPVIFPAHPRTLKRIEELDLGNDLIGPLIDGSGKPHSQPRICMIPPLGYLDFLQLMSHAKLIFTDSGGIQEESTILGIPCVTLRENTERPVTVEQGTNVLVGFDRRRIVEEFWKILSGKSRPVACPRYWDGKAAQRILLILVRDFPTIKNSQETVEANCAML